MLSELKSIAFVKNHGKFKVGLVLHRFYYDCNKNEAKFCCGHHREINGIFEFTEKQIQQWIASGVIKYSLKTSTQWI